ncbi:MFS transporter [Fluviispira vulneris]|uniref:MFS transporter n=1 Tax=Fluviispira vulneris TaxID=2763012 RepID=UPI00164517A8|nr:MFS transporter [Fluviispira vulneris]
MKHKITEDNKDLLLIIIISVGVIAGVMSSSMINLVMDKISVTFLTSLSTSFWRNTIFFTFFSVSLLFFGKVVDRNPAKKMYLIGIGIFILSCVFSLISILLKSFYFFLVTQALQGIADAIIVSAQMKLIRNIFPENKIGWTFGIFAATLSSSTLISPVVGAFITRYAHWSFIFVFQLVLALFSFILGLKYIDEVKEINYLKKERRFFSLFQFFPEEIFTNKKYIFSCLRIFCLFFASNIFWMLAPSMLQVIYKLDLMTSAIIISANSLSVILLAKKFGVLSDKDPVKCILIGSISPILGILFMLLAKPNSVFLIILAYIVLGISGAISMSASNKVAMLSVKKENTGQCMGFFQFLQFSSGAVAASFISLMSHRDGSMDYSNWQFILYVIILIYIGTFIFSYFNRENFKISQENLQS